MNIEGVSMQYSMQMQPGMRPPKPEELLADKDSDSDGSLSIEEFGMPEDLFAKIDADSDGLLTQEELESDREQMRAQMQSLAGDHGPRGMMGGGNPTQFIEQLIADKDSDGDGSLSVEEFGIPEDLFAKIDADSDGLLTQEELETDMTNKMAERQARTQPGGETTSTESSSGSAGTSSVEILGNGIDDDGDGEIDEYDTSSMLENYEPLDIIA